MALMWSTEILDTLVFEPTTLFGDPDWQSWLDANGGLDAMLAILAALPLKPSLAALRDVVLAAPGMHWHTYVTALAIHPATFYRHRKALARALLAAAYRGAFPPLVLPDPALADLAAANPAPLPTPTTSLIGRDQAIEDITAAVRSHASRLITLTGTGGIGKTRLSIASAQALAADYPDGAAFVSLADLTNPADVPASIARQLAIPTQATQSALVTLQQTLALRTMLLVLDNFEHLLSAAPLLSAILEAAPSLTMLVTSRAPLQLPLEQRLLVEPLEVPMLSDLELPDIHQAEPGRIPPQSAALDANASVQLFLERARLTALTPAMLRQIAELCQRLDGIPLAIELAAAQVASVGLSALVAELDARLLLARQVTADQRHTTLETTLSWSYQRLHPRIQRWFRQVSVFVGGWDLEAMQAVGAADAAECHEALLALLAVSLVQRELTADGRVRFRMLEVVRLYAANLRDRDGATELQARYVTYYLQQARTLGSQLRSLKYKLVLEHISQDYPNIQAALQACEHSPIADNLDYLYTVLELCEYWRYFDMIETFNYYYEACYVSVQDIRHHPLYYEFLLRYTETLSNKALFVEALNLIDQHMNAFDLDNQDIDLYGKLILQKLKIHIHHKVDDFTDELKDKCIDIFTSTNNIRYLGLLYNSLGLINIKQEKYYLARNNLLKCKEIALKIQEPNIINSAFTNIAFVELYLGEFNYAIKLINKNISRDSHNINNHIINNHLGIAYLQAKDRSKARFYFTRSIVLSKKREQIHRMNGIFNLASVIKDQKDYIHSVVLFIELIDISIRINLMSYINIVLLQCSDISDELNNPDLLIRFLSMCDRACSVLNIAWANNEVDDFNRFMEQHAQQRERYQSEWNAMQAYDATTILPAIQALMQELKAALTL